MRLASTIDGSVIVALCHLVRQSWLTLLHHRTLRASSHPLPRHRHVQNHDAHSSTHCYCCSSPCIVCPPVSADYAVNDWPRRCASCVHLLAVRQLVSRAPLAIWMLASDCRWRSRSWPSKETSTMRPMINVSHFTRSHCRWLVFNFVHRCMFALTAAQSTCIWLSYQSRWKPFAW